MNTHRCPHPPAVTASAAWQSRTPETGRASQAFALPAVIRVDSWRLRAVVLSLSALLIGSSWNLARAADAADPADHTKPAVSSKTAAKKPAAAASEDIPAAEKIDLGNDIKKALRESLPGRKQLTLIISDKPEPAATATKAAPLPKNSASSKATAPEAAPAQAAQQADPVAPAVVARPRALPARPKPIARPAMASTPTSRDDLKAKAAALAGHAPDAPLHGSNNSPHADVHWSYSGTTGPQAWGQLKPEFNACAVGKRQTPINIEDSYTLQGPAEPLLFNYQPSNGTVVNNGHTIQVNLQGNNTLTVRGSTYSLVQFHFHTPSEEQVNFRSFAMVAHLVHKNEQGQLAVVAVLLDPGQANALIDKVWTYMPLDVTDEVRMPAGLLDLDELLPKDQRYYQFMGSLTTPPCTEGVLWMVLKTPTQISQAQLRLFQQLYPNNARPVQAVNNRPIRNAQ